MPLVAAWEGEDEGEGRAWVLRVQEPPARRHRYTRVTTGKATACRAKQIHASTPGSAWAPV